MSIDIRITAVAGFSEEGGQWVAIREAGERKFVVWGIHRGKECIDRDGKECQGNEIMFLAHDRFLVEARGSGVCDLPLLRGLIDSMDLGALPK